MALMPLTVVVGAQPANACDLTTHCYGTAQACPANLDGVYATRLPACLRRPASNFATDELPIDTFADPPQVQHWHALYSAMNAGTLCH